MKHRLFIYGTLKTGFPNQEAYMTSAEKHGNHQTVERYPLVLIGERYVPCMLNAPGEGELVEGELFEVDDDCLKRIDALERVNKPDGYRRLKIKVRSVAKPAAPILEAYAYLISPELAQDRRSGFLRVYGLDDAQKYTPLKKK